MSNAGEIEAVLFKKVEGGYVFQQPNPWLFGRSSRYLVSEAQKAALLAIIMPRRPVLRIAIITIGVLLWAVAVSTAVWAFGSGHDNPTTGDFAAIVKSAEGRRVTPFQPEESLILLKPTLAVAHGGGKRLEPDSLEYELIRLWLEQGAAGPVAKEPEVTALRVLPEMPVTVSVTETVIL